MLDNLKNYLALIPENQRLNHLREYLQWLILKTLDIAGYRSKIAFVGGTALRVIFKTSRFSEDLDFSLIAKQKIDMAKLADILHKEMTRCGLELKITKLSNDKIVTSFFVNFHNLLYPLEISPNKNQPLSIKIDLDNNPPEGWKTEEFLFSDPLMFWVTHHDLPSLFAGKLHAFLFRGYDKGRDWHDLIFFLKKKVSLNLTLFQNAAKQTDPRKQYTSSKNVFIEVISKVEKGDMAKIRQETRPFLLHAAEERFLSKETILQLIKQGHYLI